MVVKTLNFHQQKLFQYYQFLASENVLKKVSTPKLLCLKWVSIFTIRVKAADHKNRVKFDSWEEG